jgi:hypothetical protein
MVINEFHLPRSFFGLFDNIDAPWIFRRPRAALESKVYVELPSGAHPLDLRDPVSDC